jgi:hypothetical protein
LESFAQLVIREKDVGEMALKIYNMCDNIISCIESIEDLDANYPVYIQTMQNQVDDLNYHCEDIPESAKIINNRPAPVNRTTVEETTDNRAAFFGYWKSSTWSE